MPTTKVLVPVPSCCQVHIPWFMDGRACATFRGAPCVDGSFLERSGELAAGVGASPPPSLLPLPPLLSTLRLPAADRPNARPCVDDGAGDGAGTRQPLSPLPVRRLLLLLLPTAVADHKRDGGLADRQFLRLKPGPELVRGLVDRGAAFARDQAQG